MSREDPTKAERIAAARERSQRENKRREETTKNAREDKDVERPSWYGGKR
jgi:hypothetical protein